MSTTIADSAPAKESLLSRVVVAPVLFVSFLVSLFLIDSETHRGIFRGHKDKDGYYHSNQKKLAKEEMDEAFKMRNKVIAGLFLFAGVGLALTGWVLVRCWHFIAHR